jgi:hypothetical protein
MGFGDVQARAIELGAPARLADGGLLGLTGEAPRLTQREARRKFFDTQCATIDVELGGFAQGEGIVDVLFLELRIAGGLATGLER